MSKYFINRDDTFILMVDIQDRLFQAMSSEVQQSLNKNCSILLSSANEMKIPVIVSEQYRKGLGETITELKPHITGAENYEKLFFDCTKDEALYKGIEKTGKKTVIISGIEAHICVFQTGLSLLDKGYRVVIASDAAGSRLEENKSRALAMLENAGALIYPTETIVFMLLEKAGTPEFKALSPLFK